MPKRDPFTSLCRQTSSIRANRADLHVHSTFSDGTYTPAQLVDLARRSGLTALAVTDHDTCAAIGPTLQAAAGSVEIIAGVEMTSTHQGRELHVLGYFFDAEDAALGDVLDRMRSDRLRRFQEMLARLRVRGVVLSPDVGQLESAGTLGRRHLAELLVRAHKAANIRQAFHRYLGDDGGIHVPKEALPVADAIRLIHQAGGVTAWAHPPYSATREDVAGLQALGLDAVEVEFPACKAGRSRVLRQWCQDLGLKITAGSDCHGPGSPSAFLGAHTVTAAELDSLRKVVGEPRS